MDCIKCYDASGNPLKYLYQWDTGQTVGISSIDTSLKLEVQICSIDSDEAMVIKHSVNNSGISACIPDILLQRSVPIMIYVCQCPDDESSRTIGAARIVVAPKARPTDYVYTESEVLNYRTLDAQMAEIRSNLSSFEDKIPATLPNPYPLSINGQNYDGSQPVNVSIAGDEVSGDFIPVPETAEVGQTIVVKAVDENGKPTEWEAGNVNLGLTFMGIIEITESSAGLSLTQINGESFCLKKMVIAAKTVTSSTTSNSSNTWLNLAANSKSFTGVQYAVAQNGTKYSLWDIVSFPVNDANCLVAASCRYGAREGLIDGGGRTTWMSVSGKGITEIRFKMGDNYTTFEPGTLFYIFGEK